MSNRKSNQLSCWQPLAANTRWLVAIITVKDPNIAHLSCLTPVGYYNKETKLEKCAQPNKVIIIYYLRRVQNEKYFPDL